MSFPLNKFLLIAPAANAASGVTLITEAISKRYDKSHSVPRTFQSAYPGRIAFSQRQDSYQSQRTQILHKMGRGLLVASNMAGVNGLIGGFMGKQPSMVLSPLMVLSTTPLLITKDADELQGLTSLGQGINELGMASVIDLSKNNKNNKFEINPINLDGLYSVKVLKKCATKQKSSLARTWFNLLTKAVKRIGADQVNAFRGTYQMVRQAVKTPVSKWPAYIGKEVKAVQKFIKNPGKDIPMLLEPSGNVIRAGVLMLYAATIPLLFMPHKKGDEHKSKLEIGSQILIGIAATTIALPKLAKGFVEKKSLFGKAVLLALPIGLAGRVTMNMVGMGMGRFEAVAGTLFLQRVTSQKK